MVNTGSHNIKIKLNKESGLKLCFGLFCVLNDRYFEKMICKNCDPVSSRNRLVIADYSCLYKICSF